MTDVFDEELFFSVPVCHSTADSHTPWLGDTIQLRVLVSRGVRPRTEEAAAQREKVEQEHPILVLLHGAGMGATSWAPMVEQLKEISSSTVYAVELRAHGGSPGDAADLSMDTMVADVTCVVVQLLQHASCGFIAVGHSLGGAVAIRVSHALAHAVRGLLVVDMVEGTAVQALHSMSSYLNSRPLSFARVEDAVRWFTTKGGMKNIASAKRTVPSLLRKEVNGSVGGESEPAAEHWTWRTRLEATQAHWNEWFKGCSALFLEIPVPKLLLVAGTERLDGPLTIGHMQGKFQLVVMNNVGHYMMEDAPVECAQHVHTFVSRLQRVNDLLRAKQQATAKLVPPHNNNNSSNNKPI